MSLSVIETLEKLSEMLFLQRELNVLINPDWAHENYNFGRYIAVELSEAHDHLGYKHWKKQTNNFTQFELEIIDAFHFYLSIVAAKPLDEANQEMSRLSKVIHRNRYNQGHLNNYITSGDINDKIALQVMLDFGIITSLYEHAQVGSFNEESMAELLVNGLIYEPEGLISKMRALYVPKNCLNIYRNKNGYKDGTYKKILNGKEDNVYLEEIMKESPNSSAEAILKLLSLKIPQGE